MTDFGLAVECAIFAVIVARRVARGSYRTWVLTFFASIAVGAWLGGMAHAWFYDRSAAAQVVWVATMLAIGVTALACWNLGAEVWGKRWRGLRIAVAVAVRDIRGFRARGGKGVQVCDRRISAGGFVPADCKPGGAAVDARGWDGADVRGGRDPIGACGISRIGT